MIYEHCFLRFDRVIRDKLEEESMPLVGFNNTISYPLGKIRLPFTVGVGDIVRTIELVFSVIREPSKYNAILGSTSIGGLQAQASTVAAPDPYPKSGRREIQISGIGVYHQDHS